MTRLLHLLVTAFTIVLGSANGVAEPPPPASEDPRPLVAVLAPLSGEHQAFGVRAWQAAAMAAAQAGDVRLLRFDTALDGPSSAFDGAVEAGADAILGPIGVQESREVAALATQRGGPPVFLLTSAHGVEAEGPLVFRLRSSPANQADALAGAVLGQPGPRAFAVFAPDDAWGLEAATAFASAVIRYGGDVTSFITYPADGSELADAVGPLVGDTSVRLVEPRDPWDEPPSVGARPGRSSGARPDAVFIPDYAANVADILPHLAFHGWIGPRAETPVALLGLSGWVSRDLERVGDLVDDATVIQVFDPDALGTASEAFALEWGARFDEQPTAFEAQAWDAAHLLFHILRTTAWNRAPETVAHGALAASARGGACGDAWFDTNGGIVRQLGLWKIDGGGFAYPVGVVEPPRDRVPR